MYVSVYIVIKGLTVFILDYKRWIVKNTNVIHKYDKGYTDYYFISMYA
jgi:hypothetical protein